MQRLLQRPLVTKREQALDQPCQVPQQRVWLKGVDI